MGGNSLESLANTGASWIDVRDLAERHVLALEKEEAGGERFIVSAGWYRFLRVCILQRLMLDRTASMARLG